MLSPIDRFKQAERTHTTNNYGSEKTTADDLRIVIFSSDDCLNDSLASLLVNTEGLSLSGTFNTGERLVQRIKNTQPDVILMDIMLSDICALEAVKLIRSKFPRIRILMLATSDEDEIILDVICAGAVGCMLKNLSNENMSETLMKFQQGETLLSPSVLRRMIELLHRINIPKSVNGYNLTIRETEVMNQIIEGASYKMVGDRLGICYNTVHNHIRSIYRKLEVNSMSEAVSKVLNAQMHWL